MKTPCDCIFCKNPRLHLIDQSEADLWYVVNERTDDAHIVVRVHTYIELSYRAGIFDERMPYLIWRIVMGDATPPHQAFGPFRFLLPQHWRSWGEVKKKQ